MKKILFLLLFTIASYGQAVFDEGIQIKNNVTDNSATKVNVQSTDGTINTISKSDLVNVVEVNAVPSLPLIGEAGKIYVVKNLNKIYRWNSTFYQELAVTDISGLQAQLDLKANDSDVIHKTGDEIISLGTKTFNISQPIVGAQFNISETANGASAVAIDNMNNGNAFYVDNKGGTAITVDLKNNSRGISMSDYSGGGQTNELFTAVKGSNIVYQLNSEGQVLGKSFVKFSAPTTNILLAGGGDLAQGTAFNKNFGLNTGNVVGATTLLNQYGTTPIDWTATAFNSGQVVFYAGKQWIAKMATVAGDVPAVSSKWEEITFEALANKTVTVDQTIIDGSTNAVSGNAVFDGLVLKSNIGHTHVASQITDLSKASVGLGNVDNTSDLSKPLSTATINALATKAPISSVHNPVTIGTANGLSLSTQQLSLGLASSGVTGALSGTDWNTFNNKQPALGFTPENIANKTDSYTTSSSTTYVSGKALVEGLGTKENAFSKNTAFNKNFGTTAGTVVEGGTLGTNAYNSTAYLPLSGGDLSGPLNINSTFIRYRTSGIDAALISSSSNIDGGSSTDFNTYVYGNAPYGIWTNGVKRVSVGGDGNTTFTGTVTALPAVNPNHVVVKSQLDAVAARPYKVYTALYSQSSTSNPTVVILENTLGTVTFTRSSTGVYLVNSSGLFTADKTFVIMGAGINANYTNAITLINSSTFYIITKVSSTQSDADSANTKVAFEIRVYN